jgi:TonB family protein
MPEARKVGFQGTVLLTAVVGSDGNVRDIQLKRALGLGLDEAAIQKLSRDWRFRPGSKDGNPVSVRVSVEVNFRFY